MTRTIAEALGAMEPAATLITDAFGSRISSRFAYLDGTKFYTVAQIESAAAEAAKCETCNGHGMVGGFVNAENGYDAEPCPDCSKPVAQDSGAGELYAALKDCVWALNWHHDHNKGRPDDTKRIARAYNAIANHERALSAKAEGPAEVSGDMARLYDIIGLHYSQPPRILITNFENIKRFSDYLDAIEREFFMVPGEPSDEPEDEGMEPDDECLLQKWPAESVEHYVEQFRAALAQLVSQNAGAQAVDAELLSNMDWAVLRMPFDLAMTGDLSRMQFYDRVQSLLNRIEQRTESLKQPAAITLDSAPLGAFAPAIMGGGWTRTSLGWKWGSLTGSGGTFPNPGGDWTGEFRLPAASPLEDAAERVCEWRCTYDKGDGPSLYTTAHGQDNEQLYGDYCQYCGGKIIEKGESN